jgi:hypothetical protein
LKPFEEDSMDQYPNSESDDARAAAPPATPRAAYEPPRTRRGGDFWHSEDSRRKSPILAALMSLMPGLGQIYLGYYQQGFFNILVIGGLISLVNHGARGLEPLVVMFLVFYWLFNVVDASRRALLCNQALDGIGAVSAQAVALPGKGSLPGGIVLIAAGMILLTNTVWGFSLEWLERWWPGAFVLGGAYLIGSALIERRQHAS